MSYGEHWDMTLGKMVPDSSTDSIRISGLGNVNSGQKLYSGNDGTFLKSDSMYDGDGRLVVKGNFAGSDAFTYGKLGLGAVNDIYNGVMAYKNYELKKDQVDANIKLGQQNYGLALAKANNNLQDRKNAHDRAVAAGIAGNSTPVDAKYKKDSGYAATTYGV